MWAFWVCVVSQVCQACRYEDLPQTGGGGGDDGLM